MTEQGVPLAVSGRTPEEPSASWSEQVLTGDDAIGSVGRLHDLIVLGRPVDGQPVPMMSTLETALFDSGRTILIAPPKTPTAMGETSHRLERQHRDGAHHRPRDAVPAQAKKVIVLTIEEAIVPGPPGRSRPLPAPTISRPRQRPRTAGGRSGRRCWRSSGNRVPT